MSGIPFGDPRHPFKQTPESARKAGRKGLAKSPWNKSPMCSGRNARRVFDAIRRNPKPENET